MAHDDTSGKAGGEGTAGKAGEWKAGPGMLFRAWAAQRRWVQHVDYEGREGDEVEAGDDCGPAWVYPGKLHIGWVPDEGCYFLVICNAQYWSTDLRDLEATLYNWALDEGYFDSADLSTDGTIQPWRPAYVLSFAAFRRSRLALSGGGALAVDPVDGWDQAHEGDTRPRPCVKYGIPDHPDDDPTWEIAGPHPETGKYFVTLDRSDYEGDLPALEWTLYRWMVDEGEIQDPDAQ